MWSIEWIELPLKYTWKLSRNQTDVKYNAIIRFESDGVSGIGEVAPNIRYNETQERVNLEFENFKLQNFKVESEQFLNSELDQMQMCPALRFGIESAFIHFLAAKKQCSVNQYLGFPDPILPVPISFTLPIMEIGSIADFIKTHQLHRFSFLKVKVDAENAADLLIESQKRFEGKIIVDGNEAWRNPDDLLDKLSKVQKKNKQLVLIEQPFPAILIDEYRYTFLNSPLPLFADESLHGLENLEDLTKQFHGINMKLMKAGGYRKGIDILNQAQKLKFKTMIGCMVETGLGISSALRLTLNADFVDLDGFLIPKNNPFPFVDEKNGMLSLNMNHE